MLAGRTSLPAAAAAAGAQARCRAGLPLRCCRGGRGANAAPSRCTSSRASSSSSRRCRRRAPPPPRAVPVPDADVVSDGDRAVVVSLEERFKMADLDGNGFIDRDELRALLQSVEGGLAAPLLLADDWVGDERVDAAMQRYDLDGNGVIDLDEFRQLVYDGILLEGALKEYEAAFRAVDASGNGSLGATELSELFRSLGQPLSMDKLAEVFMAYDKDESGQIEFGEFLTMFQDQLLDLKKVRAWLAAERPDALELSGDDGLANTFGFADAIEEVEGAAAAQPGRLLELVPGAVSVIFGERELQEVLDASAGKGAAGGGGRLVVLFCGLTWCRPCKGVARPYEKLAATYADGATFLKLYGNANASCKALFKSLKIRSTPSFLFWRGGSLVGLTTGANKARLENALRENLRPDELPAGAPLYVGQEAAAAAAAPPAAVSA